MAPDENTVVPVACGKRTGSVESPLIAVVLLAMTMLMAATYTASSDPVRSLKEIRDDGVVLQKWDKSCGAAAMATVLTYHFGDPVSEREVAAGMLQQTEPLKVRHRGGFSMLDMKRYAEKRGYRAFGFSGMTFDDIRHFDGPIVPVRSVSGYDHYVVYKGMRPNGKVRIADPAFGNYDLSRESFERMWRNGMAFVLLRGPR